MGVLMATRLDYDRMVSEFELECFYYVYFTFVLITLGKILTFFILSRYKS